MPGRARTDTQEWAGSRDSTPRRDSLADAMTHRNICTCGTRRPTFRLFLLMTGLIALGASAGPVDAQSLRGSAASLDRQNAAAAEHDFTFLRGPTELQRFVGAGLLVAVTDTRDYRLHAVSFPFTRPEVKLFIERLSSQYRSACGEQLVVTSLTRPQSHQPRNASPRSVHPTGMALDLRRPNNSRCRRWLEDTLLYLEQRHVLDATRERYPPHYHVALFPRAYARYVEDLTGQTPHAIQARASVVHHTVRRRDTLWKISQQYGTTPAQIRRANHLSSSLIHPGQQLTIPVEPVASQ